MPKESASFCWVIAMVFAGAVVGGVGGSACSSSDNGTTLAGGDNGAPVEAGDCVEFRLLEGRAAAPSNVRLFFELSRCSGVPLPGMTAERFWIEEDEKPISSFESGQAMAPRAQAFGLSTVLLLDVSGSIVKSGNLPLLVEAAGAFVGRVSGEQRVAIYLFDGREEPQVLVDFTGEQEELTRGVESLTEYEVVDPSTNLNGAVKKGLGVLTERVGSGEAPIRAGFLVVFTDGTDQAGRVTDAAAREAARASDHRVFTIGLGGEIDEDHLRQIGRDGAEFATDASQVAEAFDRIGRLIEERSQSFYVLGYCSPKRAGHHRLEVGIEGASGSLTHEFTAEGFEAGCEPERIANPCLGRECGTTEGFACGSCEEGKACEEVEGKCYDPCEGRQCGTTEGFACGSCEGELHCVAGECRELPEGYVVISAGEFMMGSPLSEAGRGSDEGPQRTVRITGSFLLKATEVTQGEWKALMGSNPSHFSSCGDECPVEQVSWWDSLSYCNALSRSEGLSECYEVSGSTVTVKAPGGDPVSCEGYRLPTEAEWEYAYRAGSTTAFYNGGITRTVCGVDPNLDEIAWYCGNSGDTTHAVGAKQANGWGLYDMAGNVWEWAWDRYGDYDSRPDPDTDPLGPGSGSNRVYRGGSWYYYALYCRAAYRGRNDPGNRNRNLGLRPARSASIP